MIKPLKLLVTINLNFALSVSAVACSNSNNASGGMIPDRKTYTISFKTINKLAISKDFLKFTLNKSDIADAMNLPKNFWLSNSETSVDLNAKETGVMQKVGNIYNFTLADTWTTINNKLQTTQINNASMVIAELDGTMWDLTDFSNN